MGTAEDTGRAESRSVDVAEVGIGDVTDGVRPNAASIEALDEAVAVGTMPPPPPLLSPTLGGDPTAVAV